MIIGPFNESHGAIVMKYLNMHMFVRTMLIRPNSTGRTVFTKLGGRAFKHIYFIHDEYELPMKIIELIKIHVFNSHDCIDAFNWNQLG